MKPRLKVITEQLNYWKTTQYSQFWWKAMYDASLIVHLQPTFNAIQFKKDNMQVSKWVTCKVYRQQIKQWHNKSNLMPLSKLNRTNAYSLNNWPNISPMSKHWATAFLTGRNLQQDQTQWWANLCLDRLGWDRKRKRKGGRDCGEAVGEKAAPSCERYKKVKDGKWPVFCSLDMELESSWKVLSPSCGEKIWHHSAFQQACSESQHDYCMWGCLSHEAHNKVGERRSMCSSREVRTLPYKVKLETWQICSNRTL